MHRINTNNHMYRYYPKSLMVYNMDEEDPGYSEWAAQVARDASRNAIQECIDMKIPYVILRGAQLIKIYPDGHIEILKEYDSDKLIATLDGSRVYKIYENGIHESVKS